MAFGQASGPPASHRQIKDLLELLQNAGHVDFRDARGPMGFTQRQAGGKFTGAEAAAFIEQLQEAETSGVSVEVPEATSKPTQRVSQAERTLRRMPAEQLAAELQRRGWVVLEP